MGYAEWKGTPRPGEKTGGQRETPNSWRETTSGKLDRKTSTLARYWLSTRAGRIPSHGGRPRDDDGEAASILRGGVSAQEGAPRPCPRARAGPQTAEGLVDKERDFSFTSFYLHARQRDRIRGFPFLVPPSNAHNGWGGNSPPPQASHT